MSTNKRYVVAYRRKREDKTNYKRRLELLKSKKIRLVVRKSSKNVIVQFIQYEVSGDKVLAQATSSDIKKLGWKFETKNLPCAYLVGYLAGTKAKKNNVSEAILDTGRAISAKGSRIYATLKGVIDSGINVPCSEEILPTVDRINGKHIVEFSKKSKDAAKNNQFSAYLKNNITIEDLPKTVDEIKKKIKG